MTTVVADVYGTEHVEVVSQGAVGPQGPAGPPGAGSGVGKLTGTGNPNGVVAAGIGTEYVDLAATNGAYSWIKTTASGTSGWRTVLADTGWRDILKWDSTGAFTIGTGFADANFVPRSGFGGALRVRRVNRLVHFAIFNVQADADGIVNATTPALVNLPAEYIADPFERNGRFFAGSNASPGVLQPTSGNIRYVAQSTVAGGTVLWNSDPVIVRWNTDTTWPTALPGSVST